MQKLINKVAQNNVSGSMFIEVIIAVAILGVMSMSLFSLQSSILKQVWYESSAMVRVLNLRNYFFNSQGQAILDPKFKTDRQLIIKDTGQFSELKFEVIPIPTQSSLYRKFPDLHLVQCVGSWSTPFQDQSETILSLIHLVPQEEEVA